MKFSYLAQQSRPIAFTVNYLAQYQVSPNTGDWSALLRVGRYLRGTHDYGLFYSRSDKPPIIFPIVNKINHDDLDIDESKPKKVRRVSLINGDDPITYADASYAEETERKSRSGYVVIVNGAAISWVSRKQSVVSLSSTEAEFYSMTLAMKEIL